jgi:hypothetical protein
MLARRSPAAACRSHLAYGFDKLVIKPSYSTATMMILPVCQPPCRRDNKGSDRHVKVAAVEFNASRLHLPRYRLSVAADLCMETESVQADASNFAVLELFTERRDMMSLPVTEQQRPIGLISRNIFMSQMSKPFYHELYGKKSCIAFMDKEPLIVDGAMSIEA